MKSLRLTASLAAIFVLVPPVFAQAPAAPIQIDASAAVAPPETGYLHVGGVSPSGQSLQVNSRFLTLDGKPWLPVMGEFHFSRSPEKYWEEELLKMKAGGVQIVAAYVFWIHHEEVEGQFDWTGQRDLRRFVALCARHGLSVYLRIGPWDHGEARNGGFPDWLVARKIPLRRNDPEYLKYVARFYGQLGAQIKGQLWQQGGPILGVQIENEYGETGPGAGAEHLAQLKKLAVAAGIAPPLFSVTGWPNHDFPPQEFVPVFGGYPDDFWTGLRTDAPPNPVYLFHSGPEDVDLGAMDHAAHPDKVDLRRYPYFGAEEGGGMETSYHRRPLIQPEDIAALTLSNIGSGVNLHGYYMFHGGANPKGKLSTLQESQQTGYPNDLPVVSYDFQAPLGQYGQERESFNKIKLIHFFLASFGSELAPMPVYLPDARPKGPDDASVPRLALRAKDNHGFLFINNYVRKLEMPGRPGFQAQIRFAQGTALVPRKPIDLPANTAMIWPVNLNLGPATLRYSTAQLIARIERGGQPVYFFFAVPGVSPEFVFDKTTETSFLPSSGSVNDDADAVAVRGLEPGRNSAFRVKGRATSALIVLLTQQEAEHLWLLSDSSGKVAALLSEASVFADGDQVHLRSTDPAKVHAFLFTTTPATAGEGTQGLWKELTFTVQPHRFQYTWEKTQEAGPLGPVQMAPVADWRKDAPPLAPPDAAFAQAAVWQLKIPAQSMHGLSDLFLRIPYVGDVARLTRSGALLDDDFYNGRVWEIGLKRFLPDVFDNPLEVRILPLRRDLPIYLDRKAWEPVPATGQVAAAQLPELLPEYEVIVHLRPASPPAHKREAKQ